jgi:hypothetical protein
MNAEPIENAHSDGSFQTGAGFSSGTHSKRSSTRVGLLRPVDPPPPDLRFNARPDACALVLAVNGVSYRAVLPLDGRGFATAEDVAGMLRAMADQVEVG